MIKIPPEVILSRERFTPVPSLLNVYIRTIHIRHIPSISKLSKLSCWSKGSLAQVITSSITIDVNPSDGVSNSDNSTCPSLIERLISDAVWRKIRIEVIVRPVKYFCVNDAKDWQWLCARSISKLGIASIARHPTHEAVFLFRPDSRLECKSFFISNTLPKIREELRNRVTRGQVV